MMGMKNNARLILAASLLGGVMWIAGCADHATETTRTTTTERTTTMVPPTPPPQSTVTTTRTQQYTP
jgi:hypothetical protein